MDSPVCENMPINFSVSSDDHQPPPPPQHFFIPHSLSDFNTDINITEQIKNDSVLHFR